MNDNSSNKYRAVANIFSNKPLNTFPTDVYGFSQFNQAEMLIEIFKVINSTNNYFVEFGARRPGILNSSYFRINKGWSGLLLDGAPGESSKGGSWNFEDIRELLNNNDNSKCRLRKEFITVENINKIFKKYNVPETFDLLTIDIDKNDYWIARSILENKQFFPRVVFIEYSSFFNSDENYVPEYKFDNAWTDSNITGSSLVSLYELFKFYNYSYVGNSAGEHAIFILNSELPIKYQNMDIPYKTASGWQYNERLKIGYLNSNSLETFLNNKTNDKWIHPPSL